MLHTSPPEDVSRISTNLYTKMDIIPFFPSLSLCLFAWLCLTAAAGYRAAESYGGSGGLHSKVCPECSVEPDG